jgi:type I restriction enzyme, S subunit
VGNTVDPATLPAETPYIGLEHMPRQSIMLDQWGASGDVSSTKAAFKRGHILFGKLRPYFHKVGIAALDGVSSTDIVVLDAKESFDYATVVSCVSSTDFVSFTNQDSDGTKMPRTSWAKMRGYPLVIADLEIRRHFQNIVGPMMDRIVGSIEENRTLAETRDYLLPRLMSGKVRVADAERAVA